MLGRLAPVAVLALLATPAVGLIQVVYVWSIPITTAGGGNNGGGGWPMGTVSKIGR